MYPVATSTQQRSVLRATSTLNHRPKVAYIRDRHMLREKVAEAAVVVTVSDYNKK